MGDKRTDSGQYYPGGKVVSQHGVAPPQIVVQWSDVQGKPQIAPLPDRYRDSDVKEKVNEIASKFATALAVALVGLTAFAGLVVQKAPKVNVWNDEEIVTNAYLTGENASGSVRTLPKYLWIADFDDSYPDDAAWYYRKPQDYGHCSSVRDGNTYSRNLDWKFNSMAEVIIRMSAGQGRFASLGVANVGTNLTEEIIASGAPTRYVKALPGHTVDGINENGVVCSVNVVDGPITGWSGGDIHPLGAVRCVLDHATSALDAATNLAARIGFPQGWSQNFHWMVADADETYIVENGDYSKVTGRAVMTNFPLINRVDGTGLERYNILMSPTANITNAWWTLAYIPATSPRRYTDLETTDESVISQIFGAWATGGRESHRGQTYGGNGWWQTVHTTVYDIENRIMRISVQEKDDWYVFTLPSGGKVKSVNGKTGDVTITADGIGALTTNLVGKTIVTGTNTHIRMGAGTRITGTDDATIILGGGTLTVPENLSVTVRGNRTLGTWGISNAYTKTETDTKIAQATPQDYETVRANAQTGAEHATRTDNPHGVTATQIGALPADSTIIKLHSENGKIYQTGDGDVYEISSARSEWTERDAVFDQASPTEWRYFDTATFYDFLEYTNMGTKALWWMGACAKMGKVWNRQYAASADYPFEADTVVISGYTFTRTRLPPETNLVNKVAYTNDLQRALSVKADKSEIPTVYEWAQAPTKPTYTADEVGAAEASQVAQLNLGYTRLYNFSSGATNANFTATNYPPTKAEADARCHFEPEAGMDFSKVPSSLQLNEYRNGEWRTVVDTRDWTVWYYKFKEIQLTNEIAKLKAENAVLSNKVAAAWADRTANGIDNPMTDTVVIDRPNMWIMADYEWQKVVSGSNQCFVIRAKNVALSGGGNTNGFLEVVDAFGKPYMRINKSAETFADPVYEDIYQDQTDGAWYVVFSNSTKPTKGGANVALRGNGDGKRILFEETDPECPAVITWPDVPESHSGHWIMKAVPKPVNGVIPSAMFFGAEIKVAGSDYVEYLKEASFGSGIRYGNKVYDPQESGNQLIFVKRND